MVPLNNSRIYEGPNGDAFRSLLDDFTTSVTELG